ncbi:hypothetical protein F0L74_02285 [Chitinophaga agrisoli]|uniref:Glycoside-hydrolase family GH114 TIM-barrel domain-containing protein n=1 Tax=Chitinophaga agrisoli TaxID=2607653 RepID=A0A5B2W0E9_9BACT|nr:endo alpha-1,4 polygalactosaminidase [Chitinophaga agrisoli]KAA2244815.1 hypothetical protein F0L74_02285 [Chitinophaga agrisoli]
MKTGQLLVTALPILLNIHACSPSENITPAEEAARKMPVAVIDYREEMRNFVTGISQYAKTTNPQFLIIPQNGIELITTNGESNGTLAQSYIQAIDAVGQEDLYYGYTDDNVPTPAADNAYLRAFLDRIKNSKQVLVTDYCAQANGDASYAINNTNGYISFAANHRELDNIPGPPYNANADDITDLKLARNFLYLINPQHYASKAAFINAVSATNYDVIIMDQFLDAGRPFTAADIDRLKRKANGGKRLVISYLSIGEAEVYRYYWQTNWDEDNPFFINAQDPAWPGNYFVDYWTPAWQDIIYGNDSSYVKKIVDSHFDGAYLDLIDAFDYFENR